MGPVASSGSVVRGSARRAGAPRRLSARRVFHDLKTQAALIGRAAWGGGVGIYESDDLTYAASIAYYTLLSLLPFLLLAFSILGGVAADDEDRTAVLDFVLRYFPAQFEFVTRQIDAFRQTRVQIGIGGGVALVWASMGVFGAISTAVNYAWGVEKARSYLKHKLFSFVMLLVAGGMLLAALLLLSAVQVAESSRFAGLLERTPVPWMLRGLGARSAGLLLLIGVVGLIFYKVPNTKVRFHSVWPGAIVTGLLWQGAFDAFSWYVRDMSRFSVHGSIAAVVIFLIWVYISAVILLYGVEFTAAYARLLGERPKALTRHDL
jgi:membrane protein